MAQIIICAIVGTALGLVAPGKLEVTQGTLTFNGLSAVCTLQIALSIQRL